jgi:hypothetical protein
MACYKKTFTFYVKAFSAIFRENFKYYQKVFKTVTYFDYSKSTKQIQYILTQLRTIKQ